VRESPGASVPSAHGKAVTQAPLVLLKIRPGGVGSPTSTLVAVDGPAFDTTMV
jgi:hypothetical protein